MTFRRAICVSCDRSLRDAVGRALATAGVAVEHCERVPDDTAGATLVVVDRADDLIAVMLDAPVSHLVGDPADRDLAITSAKLASGDLFGVEKYLAPGAAIAERAIACDADRRHAIGAVCAWAEVVGARRPL